MSNTIRILGFCVGTAVLTACVSSNSNEFRDFGNVPPDSVILYPNTDQVSLEYTHDHFPSVQQQVDLPESYHVSTYHNPPSHADRDRAWILKQYPQSYTIELANGEKASQVAGKLYKAPKTQRGAQVKYTRNSKTYFQGVYGNYATREEAEKALQALPDDVKKDANIQTWQQIQKNTTP